MLLLPAGFGGERAPGKVGQGWGGQFRSQGMPGGLGAFRESGSRRPPPLPSSSPFGVRKIKQLLSCGCSDRSGRIV